MSLDTLDRHFDALLRAARELFEQTDALVLSAGSSVSVRDMTGDVIARLGRPGVLVHGGSAHDSPSRSTRRTWM